MSNLAADIAGGTRPQALISGVVEWVSASTLLVTPGNIFDDEGKFLIDVDAPLALNMEGSEAGGLGSPAPEAADTTYFVWLWADSSHLAAHTATIDISPTAPTPPVGYDKKKLIGFVRNDSNSNIRKFLLARASGGVRSYLWDDELVNLLALLEGSSETFATIDVSEWAAPPLVHVLYLGARLDVTANGVTACVRSEGAVSVSPVDTLYGGDAPAGKTRSNSIVRVGIGALGEISYKVDVDGELTLACIGYEIDIY